MVLRYGEEMGITEDKTTIRFQADLAARDAAILESLRAELDIRSNAELLAEALAILAWVVRERRFGNTVVSLDSEGRMRELVSALVERVSPAFELPRVKIDWTPEQAANLFKLAAQQPAEPNDQLVKAMKRRR